jgi:chaperonin cofactor prefoldin
VEHVERQEERENELRADADRLEQQGDELEDDRERLEEQIEHVREEFKRKREAGDVPGLQPDDEDDDE